MYKENVKKRIFGHGMIHTNLSEILNIVWTHLYYYAYVCRRYTDNATFLYCSIKWSNYILAPDTMESNNSVRTQPSTMLMLIYIGLHNYSAILRVVGNNRS